MTEQISESRTDSARFFQMLQLLFKDPALILMLGNWRLGKTDTSLLIAELGLKWGLLDKVSSNIWTYNNPKVLYITNLPKLKRWLHHDKSTKLFIFDEAMTHLPSRTAMSKKNVSVMQLFTELSKGHGRIIFCSQSPKVDSSIRDTAFLRAIFTKERKKIMYCVSSLFPPQRFHHLPRSPIRFDKDRLAEFSETEGILYAETSIEYKVAYLYGKENMAQNKIATELDMHPQQVKRAFQKVLKSWINHQSINVISDKEFQTEPK